MLQAHDEPRRPDDWPDDEPTRPGVRRPRARVLVVEDDHATRRLIVTRLLRDGHDVYQAASGDEALGLLAAPAADAGPADLHLIDLLVVDVRMPGRSGIELLHRLRAGRRRTAALVVTAFPDAGLAESVARLGARLLAKPFPLERLSDLVLASLADASEEPS